MSLEGEFEVVEDWVLYILMVSKTTECRVVIIKESSQHNTRLLEQTWEWGYVESSCEVDLSLTREWNKVDI